MDRLRMLVRSLRRSLLSTWSRWRTRVPSVDVRDCVHGRWMTVARYASSSDPHMVDIGFECSRMLRDMSTHFEGRSNVHCEERDRTTFANVRDMLPSMQARGIFPMKRTYLLVGPRGTKKTRLLSAVASNFNKGICWANARTSVSALAAIDPGRFLVALRTHHFEESGVALSDTLRTLGHICWRETMMVVVIHDGGIDTVPPHVDNYVDYVTCAQTYADNLQHTEVYSRMLGGCDDIDRERFIDTMANHRCASSLIERWIAIRAPDVMVRLEKLSNTLHTFRSDQPLQCLRHFDRPAESDPLYSATRTTRTVSPSSSV